jgi:cbb3-type cytochrome oxidase subunit 3
MEKGVRKVWDTIKKDSLIKTIVVVLLGILAFGFAFHVMFGSGGSSMEEGSMMNSGYSLSNTLENIIELLIKVVIIGLLIGVLVWLFRTITKKTASEQSEGLSKLKEDPIIKNALIIIGVVVVLLFSFWYLKGFTSTGSGEEMMTSSSTYATSTFLSFNLTSLFTFILKALIFILLITLGYGVVMYFKENYKNVSTTKEPETSNIVTKECPECKSKVKGKWKCCPYCGSDKAFEEETHEEHQI